MLKNKLWAEAYRPKNITDYVWRDQQQRNQVLEWVNNKSIPHILMSGRAGTGKTTLAKVLVNELEVFDNDFLQINASRDNGVDFLKDKIENFVKTMPFGEFKVVLLDEADYLSHNAQGILRGLMETYASNARFILTCNFPHRIIQPIHSRCQSFHIEKLDRVEFTERVATILVNENIMFDLDVLDKYVTAVYPDLRKCINNLQMSCINGKLVEPSDSEAAIDDYLLKAVDLFKQEKFKEARKLICSNIRADEVQDLFRWMYDNLNLWGDTEEKEDKAIIIIRNGLIKHSSASDHEINLASTFIELADLKNE